MFTANKTKPKSKPFPDLLRDHIANPPPGSVKWRITPEMALEMLTVNDRNRPVTQAKVALYARQMAAGQWDYTRVPIIFSDERLIDGQHRLHAVIESEASIVSDVAFGAPDSAFDKIDVGKSRTAGDIFAINGVANYIGISAIAKWVWAYTNTRPTDGGGSTSPTAAELFDFYVLNPDIADSLHVYHAFQKNRLAPQSTMAGCYVMCARKSKRKADEFFTLAADGFGASKKSDPAFVLHKKLVSSATSNEKLSRAAIAGLTINAWNRSRDGLSGRGLRYDPEAPFPRAR